MSQTPLLLLIAPNLLWRYLVQKCDVPLAIPLDSQVDKYRNAQIPLELTNMFFIFLNFGTFISPVFQKKFTNSVKTKVMHS
jgi:phosphate starvation-inducible membrane PsiE